MNYVDQSIDVPESVAVTTPIEVRGYWDKWLEIPTGGSFVGTVRIEGRRNNQAKLLVNII